jgi:predicted small secreted protein
MNPFIINSEFHLRVVEVYKRKYEKQDFKIIETTTKHLVEEQQSVTVYKTGNSNVFTYYLFEVLNSPARDIFLYIIANIGVNADVIALQPENVAKKIQMSLRTYYKGITCLKDNYIISPYKKSSYWINPFFLFRGDRIKFYYEQCPDCINVVAKTSTGDKLTDALKE